ncbi:MAG: guanylate kinase [Gammaproteobacteria bacterium]|nr:guanylate kinase [Gammaproteobacteria bacterium]
MKNGSLYIISAPSGAGKTSLVSTLLTSTPRLEVSVSHTTRAKRPGEEHGIHYFFIDMATFETMRDNQAFLEHAKVFDHYYGTSRLAVESKLAQGMDIVLEIDWQGARQIRQLYPENISIFIIPPTKTALELRLRARAQDDEATIARRMRDAVTEISHYNEFDYLVVNDNFNQALEELRAIVIERRLRLGVQTQRLKQQLQQLLT